MAKIKGSIVGETDKAVELKITGDEVSRLKGKAGKLIKNERRYK